MDEKREAPPTPPHDEPLPEGEEEVPPGVRTMAWVRWALVAAMALVAAGSLASYFGLWRPAGVSQAATLYQCPMHPSVVQDRPGECPICGMSLVPVERKGSGAGPASPPDAGAAQARAPSAVTPGRSHEGHRHNPADPYLCPMHPEETGESPQARCPLCGMRLEKRPEGTAAAPPPAAHGGHAGHDAHVGHAQGAPPAPAGTGVPGLVPVELTAERVQLLGMRTAPVVRERLATELRTVASLTAPEENVAHIHTRFSGWIEELFVAQTGEHVQRGAVLATVYSPELLTAQQEFLNAQRWSAEGAATPGADLVSGARARLELLGVSRAEIAQLERTGKPMRALRIRSPVSGHVIAKAVVQGLYVQPGTELFQVADLSRVWALADVYEFEVGRVREGQQVRLKLPAYPRETFQGKVEFIYPVMAADTRTLRARLVFANPGLKLKPGMYGDALIELGAAEGLIVPLEAVVDTGEQRYVFVVLGGGRFEPRRVTLGSRSEAKVQVLEGLEEGETVVTTANFMLDSESRLRAAIEGMGAPAAGGGGAHGGGHGAADGSAR